MLLQRVAETPVAVLLWVLKGRAAWVQKGSQRGDKGNQASWAVAAVRDLQQVFTVLDRAQGRSGGLLLAGRS